MPDEKRSRSGEEEDAAALDRRTKEAIRAIEALGDVSDFRDPAALARRAAVLARLAELAAQWGAHARWGFESGDGPRIARREALRLARHAIEIATGEWPTASDQRKVRVALATFEGVKASSNARTVQRVAVAVLHALAYYRRPMGVQPSRLDQDRWATGNGPVHGGGWLAAFIAAEVPDAAVTDPAALADLLRRWVPPYRGGSVRGRLRTEGIVRAITGWSSLTVRRALAKAELLTSPPRLELSLACTVGW